MREGQTEASSSKKMKRGPLSTSPFSLGGGGGKKEGYVSDLFSTCALDVESTFEKEARESYTKLGSMLRDLPVPQVISTLQSTSAESMDKHHTVQLGLLYGLLINPADSSRREMLKYIQGSNRDGYQYLILQLKNLIEQFMDRLLITVKLQILWLLTKWMEMLHIVGLEKVIFHLLRNTNVYDVVYLTGFNQFLEQEVVIRWLNKHEETVAHLFYKLTRFSNPLKKQLCQRFSRPASSREATALDLAQENERKMLQQILERNQKIMESLLATHLDTIKTKLGREWIRIHVEIGKQEVFKTIKMSKKDIKYLMGITPSIEIYRLLVPFALERDLNFLMDWVPLGSHRRYQTFLLQNHFRIKSPAEETFQYKDIGPMEEMSGNSSNKQDNLSAVYVIDEWKIVDAARYIIGSTPSKIVNKIKSSGCYPRWALVGHLASLLLPPSHSVSLGLGNPAFSTHVGTVPSGSREAMQRPSISLTACRLAIFLDTLVDPDWTKISRNKSDFLDKIPSLPISAVKFPLPLSKTLSDQCQLQLDYQDLQYLSSAITSLQYIIFSVPNYPGLACTLLEFLRLQQVIPLSWFVQDHTLSSVTNYHMSQDKSLRGPFSKLIQAVKQILYLESESTQISHTRNVDKQELESAEPSAELKDTGSKFIVTSTSSSVTASMTSNNIQPSNKNSNTKAGKTSNGSGTTQDALFLQALAQLEVGFESKQADRDCTDSKDISYDSSLLNSNLASSSSPKISQGPNKTGSLPILNKLNHIWQELFGSARVLTSQIDGTKESINYSNDPSSSLLSSSFPSNKEVSVIIGENDCVQEVEEIDADANILSVRSLQYANAPLTEEFASFSSSSPSLSTGSVEPELPLYSMESRLSTKLDPVIASSTPGIPVLGVYQDTAVKEIENIKDSRMHSEYPRTSAQLQNSHFKGFLSRNPTEVNIFDTEFNSLVTGIGATEKLTSEFINNNSDTSHLYKSGDLERSITKKQKKEKFPYDYSSNSSFSTMKYFESPDLNRPNDYEDSLFNSISPEVSELVEILIHEASTSLLSILTESNPNNPDIDIIKNQFAGKKFSETIPDFPYINIPLFPCRFPKALVEADILCLFLVFKFLLSSRSPLWPSQSFPFNLSACNDAIAFLNFRHPIPEDTVNDYMYSHASLDSLYSESKYSPPSTKLDSQSPHHSESYLPQMDKITETDKEPRISILLFLISCQMLLAFCTFGKSALLYLLLVPYDFPVDMLHHKKKYEDFVEEEQQEGQIHLENQHHVLLHVYCQFSTSFSILKDIQDLIQFFSASPFLDVSSMSNVFYENIQPLFLIYMYQFFQDIIPRTDPVIPESTAAEDFADKIKLKKDNMNISTDEVSSDEDKKLNSLIVFAHNQFLHTLLHACSHKDIILLEKAVFNFIKHPTKNKLKNIRLFQKYHNMKNFCPFLYLSMGDNVASDSKKSAPAQSTVDEKQSGLVEMQESSIRYGLKAKKPHNSNIVYSKKNTVNMQQDATADYCSKDERKYISKFDGEVDREAVFNSSYQILSWLPGLASSDQLVERDRLLEILDWVLFPSHKSSELIKLCFQSFDPCFPIVWSGWAVKWLWQLIQLEISSSLSIKPALLPNPSVSSMTQSLQISNSQISPFSSQGAPEIVKEDLNLFFPSANVTVYSPQQAPKSPNLSNLLGSGQNVLFFDSDKLVDQNNFCDSAIRLLSLLTRSENSSGNETRYKTQEGNATRGYPRHNHSISHNKDLSFISIYEDVVEKKMRIDENKCRKITSSLSSTFPWFFEPQNSKEKLVAKFSWLIVYMFTIDLHSIMDVSNDHNSLPVNDTEKHGQENITKHNANNTVSICDEAKFDNNNSSIFTETTSIDIPIHFKSSAQCQLRLTEFEKTIKSIISTNIDAILWLLSNQLPWLELLLLALHPKISKSFLPYLRRILVNCSLRKNSEEETVFFEQFKDKVMSIIGIGHAETLSKFLD